MLMLAVVAAFVVLCTPLLKALHSQTVYTNYLTAERLQLEAELKAWERASESERLRAYWRQVGKKC